MKVFEIVALDEKDIPELLKNQAAAFLTHAGLFDTSVWTGETREECLSELSYTTILVAKGGNGKIWGAVRARDLEGVWVIRKLYVVPEARRKGVGVALMKAIEEKVPASCHKISVCTMLVLGENIRFFLDRGYIPDYLMPEHYNRLHLICFRKDPSRVEESHTSVKP